MAADMAMSESEFYRQQDLSHDESLRRERHAALCEQIMDGFDARDVMTSLDVVGEHDPARFHRLCEALAVLPQLQAWTIEDSRLRNIANAFQAIADFYAGFMAAKEMGA